MDLKEFITLSLTQIVQGVANAQEDVRSLGANAYVTPISSGSVLNRPESIHFDIAVTALETTEKSGKAGVQVMGVGAGGQLSQTDGTETVSRIQFSVPIVFPGEEPAEELKARADRRARANTPRQSSDF